MPLTSLNNAKNGFVSFCRVKTDVIFPLRHQLFAEAFNRLVGFARNRFDTFTISISVLDPRTYALIRHLDVFNDVRLGYMVTAIWSTVFQDMVGDPGEETVTTLRLSVIGYTRVQAGNYVDRTSSYVANFRSKIDILLSNEWYSDVLNFKDLDLAELYSSGSFGHETVWTNNSEMCTILCVVLPMYFDPCAFLATFMWCIERLRNLWSLGRRQVVEMVYVAALQSSPLPFVWLTGLLEEEGKDYGPKRMEETGWNVGRLYHEEIINRSGRHSGAGGSNTRHQVCMSHFPGMESRSCQEFTEDSLKKYDATIDVLEEVIDNVADRKNGITGEVALDRLRNEVEFLGDLNSLKFMPLCALVGLLDITQCFDRVLYGECPKGEPHGKALVKKGCNTVHLEQKFVQGLNELYGQPREYFFSETTFCAWRKALPTPQRRTGRRRTLFSSACPW